MAKNKSKIGYTVEIQPLVKRSKPNGTSLSKTKRALQPPFSNFVAMIKAKHEAILKYSNYSKFIGGKLCPKKEK